jgi:lipoyl(octanoyl) transferase
MKSFRLIRSGPGSASRNMAIDEDMFNNFLVDGKPALRIYRWSAPSFTHGFSQDPAIVLDLAGCSACGVDIARRITGGGVLFHHDEITYSFACAKEDVGESGQALVSYREICAFLINFYSSLGLKAAFALEADDFQRNSVPSSLCVGAHEKFDIVINGRKIGGNAQRRKRQFVFQHGSIPRSIDWSYTCRCVRDAPADCAAGVTTLSDEMKVVPDNDILEEKLIESFGRTFGVNFIDAGQHTA